MGKVGGCGDLGEDGKGVNASVGGRLGRDVTRTRDILSDVVRSPRRIITRGRRRTIMPHGPKAEMV